MRKWLVTLEGEKVCSTYGSELAFIDLRDLIWEFRRIKSEILAILNTYIERYNNYHAEGSVKHVFSPEQQEVNREAIIVLLGISKDGSKYGFLIVRTNGDNLIIGIWPESYAENVKKSEGAFREIFRATIENPEYWKRIDMITPTEK